MNKRLLAGLLAVVTTITIIGINVSYTYASIGRNFPIYSNSSTNVQKITRTRIRVDIHNVLERAYDVYELLKDAYENRDFPEKIINTVQKWKKNLKTAINSIRDKIEANERVSQNDIYRLEDSLQDIDVKEFYQRMREELVNSKSQALRNLRQYIEKRQNS